MATQLTASGVLFNDGTSLTSKYSVIAQNTVSVFYQAAAPTGWTQVTNHNDKALRLVNGTGGGFGYGNQSGGGGNTFSQTFPSSTASVSVNYNSNVPVSGSVGGHTLTTAEIPDHTHNSGVGPSANASTGSGTFRTAGTNQTGGVNSGNIGQSHDHPWSGSINFNVNGSGSLDLRLQYINVIICSFS
tara:strand:+ start:54 stop:614 length:561 start_codon:yes stop_codon:yes gene_type:complete